jgi:hypothetical protein
MGGRVLAVLAGIIAAFIPVGWLRRFVQGPRSSLVPLAVTGLLVVALLFSGCFGTYQAHVPEAYLTGGWKEVDSGGGGSWLGEGVRWTHVTYEVETQDRERGPFAAYLTVLSVDTIMQLDREEVSRDLDRQIREDAEAQNVRIIDGSRRTGERELASGVKTLWFTYRGEAQGGGGLFRSGNEVRIIGEVWPDERSRLTAVTVGLAQVEGGTIFTRTDLTNWHKIIMDPRGSVDGAAQGEDGLIYNVRSHR